VFFMVGSVVMRTPTTDSTAVIIAALNGTHPVLVYADNFNILGG